MFNKLKITAVIPARNESSAIAYVLNDIHKLNNDDGSPIFDSVIVCDNASNDNTATVAMALGAQVSYEPEQGYGAACLSALSRIYSTDIVVFIDADASIQIDETKALLKVITNGADLAIGARHLSWQQHGAMTLPQKWGNALAGFMIQLIWNVPVSDLGPFRAI
jgi:glycosyltransferase involved in cell wall biosynthesis